MKLLSPLLSWLHELSKCPGKRGHIVAHVVSWARKRAGYKMNVVFPCCANWETFVADTKCFLCVCVSRTQIVVSATNFARAGKRGNISVGNNRVIYTGENKTRLM